MHPRIFRKSGDTVLQCLVRSADSYLDDLLENFELGEDVLKKEFFDIDLSGAMAAQITS